MPSSSRHAPSSLKRLIAFVLAAGVAIPAAAGISATAEASDRTPAPSTSSSSSSTTSTHSSPAARTHFAGRGSASSSPVVTAASLGTPAAGAPPAGAARVEVARAAAPSAIVPCSLLQRYTTMSHYHRLLLTLQSSLGFIDFAIRVSFRDLVLQTARATQRVVRIAGRVVVDDEKLSIKN